MVKTEMYPIQQKLTYEELNKRIRYIEILIKILDRLYFVRYRYNGDSVEEAARKVGVTKRVAYIWQKRWNRDGYSGLLPRYAGGRPSKLTDDQKGDLKFYLKMQGNWTTARVKELIKEKFGVEYSLKQVRVIMKGLD
ncbi:helix-turn-helix domain-containing protein [Methanococcoides alaskense]|uniref:Transposase n=1 Tax=Methanococcoides alaskense TaxID=325778 RepID=A0AA90U0U9_9EURY|nr:helix-turn-helix domain-containing protein [Methanococcoides alaskense]MDA0525515.1 helix-turn-helix domain-containing protein [Methanococcoides alaskense]MDR6223893.1 transposase [Methanococcoides alaskense]